MEVSGVCRGQRGSFSVSFLVVSGIAPRSGWAIDPFGHSATMPYVLKQANLTSMLIQRVHYSIKKHFAASRSLEFMWRQAWGESQAAGRREEGYSDGVDGVFGNIGVWS